MNNSVTIAALAGFGGMLGWGLADFFAKKTIDVIGPLKSLVWAHLCGTSLFIIIALADVLISSPDKPSHFTLLDFLGIAFFGILQMLVYWLVYIGFEKGKISVLNPIFASYSGLVALVSIIFLGEAASPYLLLALILTFVGVMAINVDAETFKSRSFVLLPGVKEVLLAAVLATIWTLGWSKFVDNKPVLPYAAGMYAFMSLAAIVIARLSRVKLRGIPKTVIPFVLLIGAAEVVAYAAITWGFNSSSHTSIVAVVSGAFSVPTIILAYLFLKERITKLQAAAVVLILVGIVLVSLA
jgi:drug/metabolite transporter (DMT)-like permease